MIGTLDGVFSLSTFHAAGSHRSSSAGRQAGAVAAAASATHSSKEKGHEAPRKRGEAGISFFLLRSLQCSVCVAGLLFLVAAGEILLFPLSLQRSILEILSHI